MYPLQHNIELTKEELSQIVKEMDKDGDGKISYQEYPR